MLEFWNTEGWKKERHCEEPLRRGNPELYVLALDCFGYASQ
jgi:hypothetical protein